MSRHFFCTENKGITLVEGLVALMILSFGLIPAFGIILTANGFAVSIRNNIIAANLAQEGAEVVRALRDANWFLDRPFDFGLGDGTYLIEWSSNILAPVGSNPSLKINPQGLYGYVSGTDTIFKRRILITKIDPSGCGCELRIISEVSWQEKRGTRVINVESHLFNWE